MDYFESLKEDFVKAVKSWRKNYKTLSSKQLQEANEIGMQYAGKRPWDRDAQSYENQILELIQGDEKTKILDAGCGVGYILYQLYKRGFKNVDNLVGVDSSQTCINECRKRSSDNKIRSIFWDLQNISNNDIPEDEFDFVICCEVLEHVVEPLKIINELYRVLKPGGVLLCSVPHQDRRSSWMHINYFYMKASMPTIWPTKEYNLYETSDLFKLSKLKNITVGLDKRDKFIIIRGIK